MASEGNRFLDLLWLLKSKDIHIPVENSSICTEPTKSPLPFRPAAGLTLCPSVLSELKKRYDITVIPKLVVIKQNGAVITNKGRKQIRERGLACFQNWVEAADVFQNFSG